MPINPPSLSERSRRILATLVREHIESGEPIGSHVLVRRAGLRLSSATIRNVMASLEEMGYLKQPHTSAGRVPTDTGYRIYVDELLNRPRPATATLEAQVLEHIGGTADVDAVISAVPHMLSQASHHVAFATAPAISSAEFHRVDLVPLGGGRVLVVVIARNSQVSHKVVELGDEISSDDLEQAERYLNVEFKGLTLGGVRDEVMRRLSQDRVLYDRLMARALRLAKTTFEDFTQHASLFVEGASTLLDEMAGPHSGITLSALGVLVRLIEEKHRLVRILNGYMDAPGLTVIIGTEHAEPHLQSFSLVASTYGEGSEKGTVGLIGPTRMQYLKAISMVDGAAQAVNRVLKGTPAAKMPSGS